MLPVPLYRAYAGYGQSGRVLPGNGFPVAAAVARIVAGALPFSTQLTTGEKASMRPVPGPPPQWLTPGIMNNRANSCVSSKPRISRLIAVYQFTMSCGENGPPLCGCQMISLPPWRLNGDRSVASTLSSVVSDSGNAALVPWML